MENFEIDLNKYKETLEKIKFCDYTYKYIYENKNNIENIFNKEFRIIEEDNNFILFNPKNNEYSLFFYKPKVVKYLNIEKSQSLVFSTLQIDEFMKENLIKDLEFYLKDYNTDIYYYSEQKNFIKYIKGDELNFKAIFFTNQNFELNNDILIKDKFSPLELSKYFYEYFEYNKIFHEKDFIYYNTPERSQLMRKLKDFYFSRINFFKFCGPISGGKSLTLLKFTNEYDGVIYFNLKDKKLEEIQKKLNEIMEENIIEIIFIKIIELLLWINTRNILVFDQFKNIHFDNTTFEEIQKKILNTKIGIIISSSIDEKEIKGELELTLYKFNKIPKIITLQNQYYYFYVPNFLKNKIVKEEITSRNEINKELIDLYEQFSFKTKYISLLERKNLDEGIEEINKQIINKIGKHLFLPASVSIEFILLLINDNIEKSMEYKEENFNILRKIPLKFIDIHFDDEYFYFQYGFPYIKTFVEKTIINLEINKYFNQKLYEYNFYSKFKEIYFEKAVNSSIIERKIYFNEINNDEKIYKIIVNNILEMKEYDKENDAFSIINRIKNNDEKISNDDEKDYEDYYNDIILKIENKLNGINKGKKDTDIYLIKALEEELNTLKKEKENYSKIKNTKEKQDNYGKKLVKNYNEEFKIGNILIEQTETFGRCLDSAFLFGDKNNKTLICLQMKFYEKNDEVSSQDQDKLNKSYIKSVCQKILSNIYLNFGIKIACWHYILVLYLDNETKSYNTNLVKICVDNDLEYIFYDPIHKKFYNKEQKEIIYLNLNFLTNLNKDENDSNLINCFQGRKIANSYLRKRRRDLESKNSPKTIAQINAKEFENKYKLSFNDFFLKIKNKFKYIKNIDIILSLNINMDQNLPVLNNGYGYIFLNDSRDGLIFEGKTKNDENYITLNSKNDDDIIPLKINSYINIEEDFIFFIVKLS